MPAGRGASTGEPGRCDHIACADGLERKHALAFDVGRGYGDALRAGERHHVVCALGALADGSGVLGESELGVHGCGVGAVLCAHVAARGAARSASRSASDSSAARSCHIPRR
jgi:hypothetical protein